MLKIQQYVITDRVKLTILPQTFTYEIDGKVFESDDPDPYDDREEMIENALEEIAIEFANHCTEDEHEEFLTPLHKLHNQLLPKYPIEINEK